MKKEFKGSISIDNGHANLYVGEFNQTMEFFPDQDGGGMIEWDIPDLEETVQISVWVDDNGTQSIIDYDGVFELPPEAIELLESIGYNCDEVK